MSVLFLHLRSICFNLGYSIFFLFASFYFLIASAQYSKVSIDSTTWSLPAIILKCKTFEHRLDLGTLTSRLLTLACYSANLQQPSKQKLSYIT